VPGSTVAPVSDIERNRSIAGPAMSSVTATAVLEAP